MRDLLGESNKQSPAYIKASVKILPPQPFTLSANDRSHAH